MSCCQSDLGSPDQAGIPACGFALGPGSVVVYHEACSYYRVQVLMRIGDLARQTGCPIETIRYYERVGILPEPQRAHNNYRQYGESHRRRLRFVRRCRELGFSLEEIRTLLDMIDGNTQTCAEVAALGQRHINDVRAKIADLKQIESRLSDLVAHCHGANTPDCSLLEELFDSQLEG